MRVKFCNYPVKYTNIWVPRGKKLPLLKVDGMKELPIGRQTFSEFIEQDLLYVDKTRWVWELVSRGKFYFLSRPRRFGKSLLLSTLKSFFEGRKDLFQGLYIHQQVQDWKTHPIIYLDYSHVEYRQDTATFRASLLSYLKEISAGFDIEIKENIVQNYFSQLVKKLDQRYGKVVILVDEYDKPLVDNLSDKKLFEENQNILRNLYGSIKGLDAHLRFVFLTGVSRFSKVGVFSGLNNLEDISLDRKFSSIVGFTDQEINDNFSEYLEELRKEYELSYDELLDEIRFWYNGFSWDGKTRLYNPFSMLSLLQKKTFDNYWFSTGTPSFLVDLVKQAKLLPETFENVMATDLVGSSMNFQTYPLIPLLFQTGYLTISRTEKDGVRTTYYLSYPNEEVRYSFLTYLVAAFVEKDEFSIQPEALNLRDALKAENIHLFTQYLQSFFSDIPSRLHINQEAYYHSLMYMLLRLVGVQLILEKETDKGRIDGVLELNDRVYIIECKFAGPNYTKPINTLSDKAICQIEDRKYYEPWLGSGKKIILLGIGFHEKAVHGKSRIVKIKI